MADRAPFQSGVTDFEAIRKRWEEMGSDILPIAPKAAPQPPEPDPGPNYDYGCGCCDHHIYYHNGSWKLGEAVTLSGAEITLIFD